MKSCGLQTCFAYLGLVLLCLPFLTQGGPYKAAVVEYTPTGSVFTQTPAQLLGQNLAQYGQYITQAAALGADIIVFPEYGITTLTLSSLSRSSARPFLQQVPPINSSATATDCSSQDISDDCLAFTFLSCAARQNALYVAANFAEIVLCTPGQFYTGNGECLADGAFQYSTNVVFDRDGRLVARYRKTHLFLEPPLQEPTTPDFTTFRADFGVEFGLLTCFDIMFYEPALTLHYERGIRDFIFPTAWVDELPFLTAAQIQEGWSRFLGVHLLASGYHLPSNGQLGSGVFGPNGPINYTFTPDLGSLLVIGQVGDTPDNHMSTSSQSEFIRGRWLLPHGMLYENLTGYSSLELETGTGMSASLCHEDLCCQISYSSSCPGELCDHYKLLTYTGPRTLGGGMYTVSIQLCGVVVCSNSSIESCARSTVNNTVLFDALHMAGNFSSALQVYPTAITKDLQLLPFGSLELILDTAGSVALNSVQTLVDVLAVGLYGRAYSKDD